MTMTPKRMGRIKKGAVVFQDRSFPHWGIHIGVDAVDTVFEVSELDKQHDRFDLTAWGYGLKSCDYGEGAYGNGSLFVNAADVIFLSNEEADAQPPFKVVKYTKPKADDTFPNAWSVLATLREMDVYEEGGLDMIEKALAKGEELLKEKEQK